MNILSLITWFSGISFLYFGINCFYSQFIISEFVRYGLASYRKLTGFLQIMGGTGLLIGIYFSNLLIFLAASGLFVLMLLGFLVRIKIKDNFIKSSPAFLFAVINLILAIKTFTLL